MYIIISFYAVSGLISCSPKIIPKLKVGEIPKEIMMGDSLIFNWQASNAKYVVMNPMGRTLDTSGTVVIKPQVSKPLNVRFTAYNGKNRAGKSFSVNVLLPELSASVPAVVSDEGEYKVTWYSVGSDYVIIDGIDEELPVTGEFAMMPDTIGKVVITAYNRFGYKTQKILTYKIKYLEGLQYKKQIMQGDSCLIKWKFKKTKNVFFKGIDSVFNPVDSVYVKPIYTAVYNVCAVRNNGDTLVDTAKIKVDCPGLLGFFAPMYIYKNSPAVLIWRSRFLPFVSIEGVSDSLPPNGYTKVRPLKTTTYFLKAKVFEELQVIEATVNVVQRSFVVSSKDIKDVPPKMRLDFEIFASDFTYYPDSVKLYVVVVDTTGNFITGLAPPCGTAETSKRYFRGLVETTSAGKKHNITSYKVREVHEKKELPVDVNMTLDYSGSMYGLTDKLEEAYKLFINKKPASTRLSMIRFSDTIITTSELTAHKQRLLSRAAYDKMNEKYLFGGTALYAAMDDGIATLAGSKNPRQMMVFTDGYESSSFYYFGKKATFAQQVAKKAIKENIRINTIGYGYGTNDKVLNFLAAITGGTYYSIFRPEDIKKAVDECLYLNNNYYVITYKPVKCENGRDIVLMYNSNNGETGTTYRDARVGGNYNLQELETEIKNSYWNIPARWGNLKAVSLPQPVTKFDFGKWNPKPGYEKHIKPFVNYLKKYPSSKVVIFGHADNVGSDKDCDNLSLQRAMQVKAVMTGLNVPGRQIIIEACGKKYPVWKTEDKPWKAAENRRVELMIIE